MFHRKDQKNLENRFLALDIKVLKFEPVGKHCKVHIQQGDTRCFVIVGSTISDWRAVMNIVSTAKKNLKAAKEKTENV